MGNFVPDEKIIKIMKNFSEINPSMLIEPDKLGVVNISKSVIAKYSFDEPFDTTAFGLYNTPQVLGILNALTKPEIEVKDKLIVMNGANGDKVQYWTAATDLVPKIPSVEKAFASFKVEAKFTLSSEKLAILTKMVPYITAKFVFFETDNKRVMITLGEALNSSTHTYEIPIEDSITTNEIDGAVKLNVTDLNILAGEYEITVTKKITKWENLNGVIYYIVTAT